MYTPMYIHKMIKKYSIAEARSSLPTLIDQAEAGHEVELTRRGKPVAVLLSRREFDRLRADRPGFGTTYANFLKNHSPADIGLEKDFARTIRTKERGRKVSF